MTKKRAPVGLFATLSSKYDIQPDMMACHLELRGRGSLAVGGCKGILEYSPICVRLRLRAAILCIRGLHLVCDSYTSGELHVSGRINSIEFEDRVK